jgi:hypothetical protein
MAKQGRGSSNNKFSTTDRELKDGHSRKSIYHRERDHLIFTPAACSDLMQLLDQMLQLLGSVHILAVGLTWQRSWTRRWLWACPGVPAQRLKSAIRPSWPWRAPCALLISSWSPRRESFRLLLLET